MSTVQSNLRGVLVNLRNAGVFDSIQAADEDIHVTRGQWTIRYWVSPEDNAVHWCATHADDTRSFCNSYACKDYATLLVGILNSMVGHFPVDPPAHDVETPAREVLAGDMDKSYIGRTVTMPWKFRGHEATITGVLEAVKHDEYRTYFELEDADHRGYVYKCDSESVVVIHPEPEANDEVEESDQ